MKTVKAQQKGMPSKLSQAGLTISKIMGICPKECAPGYDRGTCSPMFIAALFTIAKLWKQPRCPITNEWIKKMWYM
jgi:hypothetical protein